MKPIESFKTHTGEIVTGKRLQEALSTVADDWAQLAHDIWNENPYATHVPQSVKDQNRDNMLEQAEHIRQGFITNLTISQRLNTKLTGKCVPLLR